MYMFLRGFSSVSYLVRLQIHWKPVSVHLLPPHYHTLPTSTALLNLLLGSLPFPIDPLIRRVESPIPPVSPLRRSLANIVLWAKLLPTLKQLKELGIVDERVPFPVEEEAV